MMEYWSNGTAHSIALKNAAIDGINNAMDRKNVNKKTQPPERSRSSVPPRSVRNTRREKANFSVFPSWSSCPAWWY